MASVLTGARSGDFRSDAGRPLTGNGGIVPDVELPQDTLTAEAQRLARALGGRTAAFRDAIQATALSIRAPGAVTSEACRVSRAMRQEVRRRLALAGVTVAESTFEGGGVIVDQQLGYEIARYRFGAMAERRRRVADDSQVTATAALLRGARGPFGTGLRQAGPPVRLIGR